MKRIILLCLTLLAVVLSTNAQMRKVTGRVTDQQAKPLEGVSIGVVETQVNTMTDEKGQFSIQAEPGQTLKFSYVGAAAKTFKVGAATTINMELPLENNALNEVVVTGYQKERKKDLTGAVSVVNVKEIRDIPLGNPIKALQGRVPGVFISADGAPNGGASVRIRGVGTLGNNDPLYIIDGIPTKRGLQELNQNDIESIQVLKDASSATIYGSRAANGVIIVTTKRAKAGYSRIDFDASLSLQYYNSKIKTLNAEERGKAYWQAAVNDRANPNANQIYQYEWNGDFDNPVLGRVVIPEFIDAAKTMRSANTNWYDEISQTSLLQSYNISMANGNEKGNSLFSVSYYDNKGIIKETRDKKLTGRLNSDYSFLNGKLRIGENFSGTYMKDVLIPTGDVTGLSQIVFSIVPVNTLNGGWGGPAAGMADRQNPVRLIQDNKQNYNNFWRVFGNVYADFEIIPKLNFRTSYAIDYNGNYARTLRKSYVSGFLSDPSNAVNTNSNYDGNRIWQNTLTYAIKEGKHQADFLVGQEQINTIYQGFGASRQGLALENTDYAYLDAGSTNKDNGGNGTSSALLSYFAKANYTYNDRYLLSATIRRDGSSRFGKENQFGYFPAFSLGWRLSEEDFIKKSLPFFSDLKLRYGWGKNGNQEIANNATYTLYSAVYGTSINGNFDAGTAYDIVGSGSGQLPSGFSLIQQGNNTLKWEATAQHNFGVDFGLFNGELTGSMDYFIKKTSDILIRPAYLAVIGEGGSRFANGASMKNTGFEFILSWNKQVGKDWNINITGNASAYNNEVTELPSEILTSYPGNGTDKTILGRPINSLFGYVADGVFKNTQEVNAHATQPGKGVGRIRYKDLNGDGIIDPLDRDYIGNSAPDFIYGLNTSITYKNFDLSFFLQGVQGADVNNGYKYLTDFSSIAPGANFGVRTLDAFTPQNSGSGIPALTLVDRNNEGRFSTYFIEDGSYLKLRNIQLGYNLQNALKKLKVQRARVFIQASNLLTIKSKSYTATDPENPGNAYPIPVITTLGVNVSF
ncbi:TonB-dependent receptor [Pedobacter sp. G11]|uniref:SusC/RagA family TonB-linked outer membrane protein n=1 Tax=Pedobacter sp. G11 TaxID=2482728 RepID=UPI000F6015D4|nr:TonB-dependent receptor [Pedobacter sp. G11]AZI26349.1 TonB-dependent receptor [Pedobacter sp. G11]